MSLIARLRSRCGLRRIHLEPDAADDGEVTERIKRVLQFLEAVPDGSSGMPGWSVEYYTVGREGFRIETSEYPGIEGINVWGSKKILTRVAGIWRDVVLNEKPREN